jgi:hypothetical protein
MPKVQRKDIPRALFAHLPLRIEQRSISAGALKSLATLAFRWTAFCAARRERSSC